MSNRFNPGRLLATPGALKELNQQSVQRALVRRCAGDWGDVDQEDALANDRALHQGARLLSAYHDINGVKFWIITEADRSSTTVLLPSEY